MAVAPRGEKGTATTSTAGTPKRFRQLAGGYERPLNDFAALGEVAESPQIRTSPIRAYGSYLECLTAKRCCGHGRRIFADERLCR